VNHHRVLKLIALPLPSLLLLLSPLLLQPSLLLLPLLLQSLLPPPISPILLLHPMRPMTFDRQPKLSGLLCARLAKAVHGVRRGVHRCVSLSVVRCPLSCFAVDIL
jgi:hypothetical protein